MLPTLKLFNTLGREKQDFVPLDPGHVRLYACGPTVYSYAHIGNARMAVTFDLLYRVLKNIYRTVTYVSNITDVDDKIMDAAQQTGEPIASITHKYAKIYNEDMAALGCVPPTVQPRATEHIPDMIALIADLIARGHAYENQRHVLFNVPSFPKYGGLSGRNRDDQIAGARVEVAPYKKDPADFVLWKPSVPDQPGWDSPWGRGRPGWHIECSAMSQKHLGLPFDIHGGGIDLTFPHHENEIAQSCCAAGAPDDLKAFARYWVHNGFVMVEGQKMSKSLGNVLLVHDLLAQAPGEALRYALLSAHYRQPLDWTAEGVKAARRLLDRMYQALYEIREAPAADDTGPVPEVWAALCDDLNTPRALAGLLAVVREAAETPDPGQKSHLKGQILASGALLGVLKVDPAVWLGYGGGAQAGSVDADSEAARIDALLREREAARKSRDFKRADAIRDELAARSIVIEDTPQGARWKKI